MKPSIYLDNAATTCLDPEVLQSMLPYLTDFFGNPSSGYSHGRTTRMAIEKARKTIATLLHAEPGSIYFTSGGTESNNTAIAASVLDLGCTHIITSPIEHHAVLHTVEYYGSQKGLSVSYVPVNSEGIIEYDDLEKQLQEQTDAGKRCLVSLMHANNEIGSLLDVKRVGVLCKKHNAIFHSDCVQTVGHYPLNVQEMGVHFISGAGHKFHGPKGAGILYVHPSLKIQPLIYGGGQERNLRAGTENVYGIVGFAKALEMAMQSFQKESEYISGIKNYLKKKLIELIPGVSFNGPEEALYTVLSVCFPKTPESESLLLSLDMEGVCVSGGSACSSGSNGGSHVIQAIQKTGSGNTIRFSFSRYNTIEEIDRVAEILGTVLSPEKLEAVN